MKKNILVIDNLAINQESALQTIDQERYNLTIATSVDEAMKYLGCRAGYGFYPSMYETGFDVVLTDLMLPASTANFPPGFTVSGEFAYGFAVALKAIMLGVKYVGIISNGNHHADPMASMADAFNTMSVLNGVRLLGECQLVELKGVFAGQRGKNWGASLERLVADGPDCSGLRPRSERPEPHGGGGATVVDG